MTTDTRIRLGIRTSERQELVDITDKVAAAAAELDCDGAVLVASLHTTAAITVNEGHDPDVATDLVSALDRIVPEDGYDHDEGNSAAHVKVALVGAAQVVPTWRGRLDLGQWQRVFLCEFDGPRDRTVIVTPVSRSES